MKLDPALVYTPERVVSIVSSSRSGSTIFKHALALHPELCSLAGEEEPYYKLAENGYPWHLSDEFHAVRNSEYIRQLIANELHNYASTANRKWLQANMIEEPPFVEAVDCRQKSTLVLKTPQNCYRRGVIEQLYPRAQVLYIVVSRDKHAVLNGLIDGWESGMFTARQTPGGWWCFDMPPNWSWQTSILERCKNQLCQSRAAIVRDYPDALVEVEFEWFLKDWVAACQKIWAMLKLAKFTPTCYQLPILCATDQPTDDRWKIKRPWLSEAILW